MYIKEKSKLNLASVGFQARLSRKRVRLFLPTLAKFNLDFSIKYTTFFSFFRNLNT